MLHFCILLVFIFLLFLSFFLSSALSWTMNGAFYSIPLIGNMRQSWSLKSFRKVRGKGGGGGGEGWGGDNAYLSHFQGSVGSQVTPPERSATE